MKTITKITKNENGQITQTEETKEFSDQNSVSLTVDAKGNVKPEVKVYDADPVIASTKAQEILQDLIEKYKIKLSE